MPVIGKIPKFMPMLTKPCAKIKIMKPEIKNLEKLLLAERADFANRQKIKASNEIRKRTPKKPHSSAIAAKIKSVCCSGRKFNCDCVPRRGLFQASRRN